MGPDDGTNSSTKPKVATSETAEPVELDMRNYDKTVHLYLIDVEAEDIGIHTTENVEEMDEKCSCPAVS